jgi:glycosyltransferase involved in cell wall biosynthesis
MRILLVHNEYGKISGEEIAVGSIRRLLEENGHEVIRFGRSSAEIQSMRLGRTRAFFSGIYSFSSGKAMRRCLLEFKPDIMHVHNVFPLVSASVLIECRRAGAPIVMTVHNYRLVCPNGLFLRDEKICEECSGGREWWCFLRNCEKDLFKSLGYALRSYVARKLRLFRDNITTYVCQTNFQRERLVSEGYPANKFVVIPNMASNSELWPESTVGDYVGFVGRVSAEKGVLTLLKAARLCGDIRFKAAGSYDRVPDIVTKAPPNFSFSGHLDKEQLGRFYGDSRMIVLCSICYEGLPSVILEAMLHGKPVVCSRIGGLEEIVSDEVTGLLFEPGDADDLAEKIRYLWNHPELCRKMGQAGRERALREYGPQKFYERLMAVYEKAIESNSSSDGSHAKRTTN